MKRAEKSATRFAVAAADGSTTEVEGADRPVAPHDSKMATPVPPYKPHRFVILAHYGSLRSHGNGVLITELQRALITRGSAS